MKKKEKLHYKNNLHFYFQIFVPEEATRETSTGVIEKVKADQCLTHLHHRATSKPRHEKHEINMFMTLLPSTWRTQLQSKGSTPSQRQRRHQRQRRNQRHCQTHTWRQRQRRRRRSGAAASMLCANQCVLINSAHDHF